jgi:hypothetical protein
MQSAQPAGPRGSETIEPTMRRVFVPQSERACICAFGKRLASATPKMIEEVNQNVRVIL